MERPKTFREWTDFLVHMLKLDRPAKERGWPLPNWNKILVAEEENGQRGETWIPASDFEPRFREVLRRTTRSWVNLHVDRVEHATLYLVVEFISRDDSSVVKVAPDRISVNMSGPKRSWLGNASVARVGRLIQLPDHATGFTPRRATRPFWSVV